MKKFSFIVASLVAISVAGLSNLANAGTCGSGCTFTENTADFLSNPGAAPNPVAASFAPGLFHQTLYVSVSGVYRSPYENAVPPNSQGFGYGVNPYSSVQGGGTATFNTGLANALSLLWGSPDSYNTLQFWSGANGTGSLLYSIIGTLLVQTYGHDQVNVATTSLFQSVVLISGTNAFEFAGLSASCNGVSCRGDSPNPTPIPGAAFLMGSVLAGGAGFSAWRRRRKTA
jgi:hypothetical protein